VGIFDVVLALEIVNEIRYWDERAALNARRIVRSGQDRERLSRVRWLEQHHAERSFPCGIAMVPETEGAPPRIARPAPETPPPPLAPPAAVTTRPAGAEEWQPTPPMPVSSARAEAPPLMRPAEVTAVVLPNEIAFLLEDGIGEVEEAGRFPRTAITGIDVVDERGVHVPEPIHETIEPSQLVFLVLRWMNAGADDEDRFAFRSPWLAWRAGRKLIEARRG
jgi:hypothetical protein